MKKNNNINLDLSPSKQKKLFGYEKHFNLFVEMINKDNLPKVILLKGMRGLGKTTFAYHLINYILSKNEDNAYDYKNHSIIHDNKSFNLIQKNLHPNFYLIQNIENKKNIEIDQIRQLNNFLNKTTYLTGKKIILIRGGENLNVNAANAILKITEEPTANTFFFIIQDSMSSLVETLQSRCIEFQIYFNKEERKYIFNELLSYYNLLDIDSDFILNQFPFETPGRLIHYINLSSCENISIKKDINNQILDFVDIYIANKKNEYLNIIQILIENFYYKLYLKNSNETKLFNNKINLIKKIKKMKKFNLDEKNVFFEIKKILSYGK